VQDFVGVRVADAAEEAWIGECPLQRMVFALKLAAELDSVARQWQ
jgi:hypothetical protein